MTSASKPTKQSKKGVEAVEVVAKEVAAPKKEVSPKKETASKKKDKKVDVDAVVSAPEVSVETVDKEVAVKVAKVSKKEKKVVSVPVPEQDVVVTSDDVATPAVAPVEASVSDDFAGLSAKLVQLGALVSAIRVDQRSLEKKIAKELKAAQKSSSRRKPKTGTRNPSGFVKPTLISDELASFLGKTAGTEMARTSVTREINQYIRSNNLQDATNGRIINPDVKLTALLKLKETDELTYFNLQRYMSPHFPKATAPVVASAPVASETA